MKLNLLLPSFYADHTPIVAKNLLGQLLVKRASHTILVGRITETEAYHGMEDTACHGYWRRRETCRFLWSAPGHAYVYRVYGTHWLLNVSTYREGFPSAVLIRAVQPIFGIAQMQLGRPTKNASRLTNGPGKLTQAFGIDGTYNGDQLWTDSRLSICQGVAPIHIRSSPRIGIGYATNPWKSRQWRFFFDPSLEASANLG